MSERCRYGEHECRPEGENCPTAIKTDVLPFGCLPVGNAEPCPPCRSVDECNTARKCLSTQPRPPGPPNPPLQCAEHQAFGHQPCSKCRRYYGRLPGEPTTPKPSPEPEGVSVAAVLHEVTGSRGIGRTHNSDDARKLARVIVLTRRRLHEAEAERDALRERVRKLERDLDNAGTVIDHYAGPHR